MNVPAGAPQSGFIGTFGYHHGHAQTRNFHSSQQATHRIRAGTWRILIGEDAKMIDERVRAKPDAAYDYAELFAGLIPDSGDQAS